MACNNRTKINSFNVMHLRLLAFLIAIILSGCVNRNSSAKCVFYSIEEIFSVEMLQPGVDTEYTHYVLMRDFDKACIDSTEIVSLVLSYVDTVSSGKPVGIVNLYNSSADFEMGEIAQDWNKVNKRCLVQIWLNKVTRKPESFIFFDDNGDQKYSGPLWLRVAP